MFIPTKRKDCGTLLQLMAKSMKWYNFPYSCKLGEFESFEAVCAYGDFDGCWDYSRGLVDVTIYTTFDMKSDDTHDGYYTMIHISNIDDGSWVATSARSHDLEKVNELTKKVAERFADTYGIKLPSEEEFNDFLQPFGMYGCTDG